MNKGQVSRPNLIANTLHVSVTASHTLQSIRRAGEGLEDKKTSSARSSKFPSLPNWRLERLRDRPTVPIKRHRGSRDTHGTHGRTRAHGSPVAVLYASAARAFISPTAFEQARGGASGSGWRQGRVRWGWLLLSRPRGAVGSGPVAVESAAASVVVLTCGMCVVGGFGWL